MGTQEKHMKTHRSLVKLAEELGVQTDIRYAQTGTVYVAFERKGRSTKIRFADHADAYGRADYTADGVEGTLEGARKHLLSALHISEAAVRRLRRAMKSRTERRRNSARASWIEGVIREHGYTREEAEREAQILFK